MKNPGKKDRIKRKIVINVLDYKVYAFIFSGIFILLGLVFALIFHGFNTGIDFGAGFSERVQIAPAGLAVYYTGQDQAVLQVGSGNNLEVQFRSPDGVRIVKFPSSVYPRVSDLAKALNENGLSTEVFDGSLETSRLISGFGFPRTLSSEISASINFATSTRDVTIEDLRDALKELGDVKVQTLGQSSDGGFQIRMNVGVKDNQRDVEDRINNALSKSFGPLGYVVMQSDFVGPKFSSSLLKSSIYAVLLAIALVLLYIALRFTISYALSSIIALLHDVLAMLSFILIFRLEVSATTIAAVLTIIGYSLNNTIVIFDRIRQDIKKDREKGVDKTINLAVRQSFTRTIITSLTTLFAIIPLALFSTGDIKLFAINLTWGIIAGTYSSNFIAPALLSFFNKFWPIDKIKVVEDDGYIGG